MKRDVKTVGDEAVRIIEELGASITHLLVKRVARKMQQYKEGMLSGDDSGFINLWDDYCAQIQYERAFGFDLLEDVVIANCQLEIENLQNSNIDEYHVLFLYSAIKTERMSATDCNDIYVAPEDFLFEEVYKYAMNYTNSRITNYLNL